MSVYKQGINPMCLVYVLSNSINRQGIKMVLLLIMNYWSLYYVCCREGQLLICMAQLLDRPRIWKWFLWLLGLSCRWALQFCLMTSKLLCAWPSYSAVLLSPCLAGAVGVMACIWTKVITVAIPVLGYPTIPHDVCMETDFAMLTWWLYRVSKRVHKYNEMLLPQKSTVC